MLHTVCHVLLWCFIVMGGFAVGAVLFKFVGRK